MQKEREKVVRAKLAFVSIVALMLLLVVFQAPMAAAGPITPSTFGANTTWTDQGITYTAPLTQVIYNSIPSTLLPNYPSQNFECCGVNEIGDYVAFAGTQRTLSTVTVLLSDYGTHSQYPSFGTTTSWGPFPITLNLYDVVGSQSAACPTGDSPCPGIDPLLTTVTQSFVIPWRPETTPFCSGNSGYNVTDGGTCYHGFAFSVTFDFSSMPIVLPDAVIFGITYNTQSRGFNPTGIVGPSNSLNVVNMDESLYPTTIGTDMTGADGMFRDATSGPSCPGPNCQDVGYNTAGPLNVFRLDTGWATSGDSNLAVTFTVTGGNAYYPSVLYDANAFSGHGDSYYYKMWYSTGSGIALAYSNDGKAWTAYNSGVELSTLTNAHHNRVLYDAGGFGGSGVFYKMWYEDTSQLYSINAIRYAESVDGIIWVNDQPITQDASAILIDGSPSDWNAGSYGPVWLFYNPGTSNSGSSPYGYSYVMYYDATTGGIEQIALAYSSDGKFWTAYGTGPVLPVGGSGSWDQNYATHGSILREPGKYLMWYSGGVNQAQEGIGYAESSDGLVWTKSPGNPIFSIYDSCVSTTCSYRNERTYTPTVVNDGSGNLKMYYSAQGSTTDNGNKQIGLAMSTSPTVVVIRPNVNPPPPWGIQPNGQVAVTTGNAIGTVVPGPGGQSGGLLPGSVEYDTNSGPGGKPQLYAPASLAGVKLTDLTALSFSSYISHYADGSPWLTITVNVGLDLGGGLKPTMVFEPCYTVNSCTGPIQPLNTWATWDALAPGAIWWSTKDIPNPVNPTQNLFAAYSSYSPLTTIYQYYPDARITFLEFQAGQGSGGGPWNNFVGNLDGVTIGVGWVSTTYDFEPDLPVSSITISSSPTGSGFVSVDGGGISTPQTYSWNQGDTHTLTAASSVSCGTGCQYEWTSWNDSGLQSHSITVPGSPTTYTATFTKEWSISFSYALSGTPPGSPTAPTLSYTRNGVAQTPVPLSGTPTAYWVDDGTTWTVSPNPLSPSSSTEQWSTNQATSAAASASTTISLTYYHQYYLTMTAGTGGTVAPVSGWENAGAVVTITATANSGYAFSGWTGSGTGSYTGSTNPSSVTMNDAITETANFVQVYSLTVSAGSGGTVGGTPSGSYAAGYSVSITATPNTGYVFSSWTITGTSCTGGSTSPCAFSMPSNAVSVTANFALTVTVKLLDSGNGVSGGVVDYYDTSWHSFGTTDATGAVSMSMNPGAYLFRMTYANVQVMYYQDVGANPTVTFQAKLVTVKLLASDGTTQLPGTVQYQSTAGAWVTFGSGTTTTTMELLSGKYVFEVIYVGGTATMNQDVSVNPTVLFHTVKVTEQLKDSVGNGLSGGTAKYYGTNGWNVIGTTGADGNAPSLEMLPATYTFRMVYASGQQDLSQNVGTNPTVLFQTTLVTMKLLNHDGSAQLNGVASYTGGTFGSGTTTTTMQLLPVTYTFKVTYAGASVSTSQNVGTNPTVIFQTGQVHSTSGKCTGYTYGTFTQNMELLPGTYKFYFSDGTATTSYTIVAGTTNTIH